MSEGIRSVTGDLLQEFPSDLPAGEVSSFIEFRKEEIEQSIPERFDQIVRKSPKRIAVKTADCTLSYYQLNEAANRIARAILTKHGESQEPVVLLFEHGIQAVIAILGVLKAGKIYVPLDPSFPHARIMSILEDSESRLLVTNRQNWAMATELTYRRAQLLDIEAIDANVSGEDLGLPLSPVACASIMYTSGSTGQPKGVLQNHRGILHKVRVYTNLLHICSNDRLTLLHSHSFDACMHHLFGSLLNGATLFPCDLRLSGGSSLAKWLIQEQISIYHSVPTVFREMTATLTGKEEFPRLRAINLSGAPMHRNDVELYKRYFPSQCMLLHMIGATETGWMRHYFINKTTQITGTAVPVGYAIEDKEISLIGDNGLEVGFNEIGEIAIKSRYLSLGYWRKPDLTAAKFLPDPSGGDKRFYLTGDLGMLLPDGCLIHLGRKDFQVKIRGHRIEVGEIEALLLAQANVREVVVVKWEMAGVDDERLVAYIVPVRKPPPTITELRQALKEKLPEYMVPSAFVFLDALPLTPNGKVDRRALPAPDQSRPKVEATFMAPQDMLELQLRKIWEKLLRIQSIGVHDNFFELGGHSLLAVQLMAQVENAFGKHLSPAILFQAPTIAQLASILRQEKWPGSWSSLMPIQPGGSKPPFFWVHGDSSNAFLPYYLGPDQPLYGLEHQSQDGKPARYTTVETIAAHYLEEIRTIQPEGPYFLGGYSFGGTVVFEMAQQLRRQRQEVALLVLLDSHFPGEDIPSSHNGLTNITLFRDEAHRHLRNLALLGGQKKLAYLLVRVKGTIKGKINERTARISKPLKKLACNVCIAMGRPIPLSLRSLYILDIYYQARRNYIPQLYPGRAIYFRSEKRSSDHRLNWGKLIAGELEVHEVPGGHMDLREEPYIRFWAEPLKNSLEKAQSMQSRDSSRRQDRI